MQQKYQLTTLKIFKIVGTKGYLYYQSIHLQQKRWMKRLIFHQNM